MCGDPLPPPAWRHLTPCEKAALSPYINSEDLDAAILTPDVSKGTGFPIPLLPGYVGLTIGNNIYFAHGAYNPSNAQGLAYLGHELVHVGQYRNGMNLIIYGWSFVTGLGQSSYEQAAYAMYDKVLANLTASGFSGCPDQEGSSQ